MCVVEQIERFARRDHWQVHLYSQKVEQVEGVTSQTAPLRAPQGEIVWHHVPGIAGPHLLKYAWWFVANHWKRRRDRVSGRVTSDLVYSPGINCLDADVIVVHIVFHAFYESVKSELRLRRVPLRSWPRVIHRKLYYRLVMALERKLYRDPIVRLIAVSTLVARQLTKYFLRTDVAVIPNAVDTSRFCPEARCARRSEARQSFPLADNDFVILLIGNDWKKKGLDTLLRAAAELRDIPLQILVVGKDDPGIYRAMMEDLHLRTSVRFERPSADVLRFYAAADVYAGPSLEDAFNLPILEAMACGLPVIASGNTGASEFIHHGEDGLILPDPQDAALLGEQIRNLLLDQALRVRIGQNAAQTIRANCDWDKNAEKTKQLLISALHQRELA